jgi:hypothetical protein
VFDGRGTFTPAQLDCGAAGKPGGGVQLPPKGTPVTCTYKLTGQPVADGAVLPVVVPDGVEGPVPAPAAVYTLRGAPTRATGACAQVGSSLQLLQGGRAARWQPGYAGKQLGSEPVCASGARRFGLWFGATPEGARLDPPCGDYAFKASFSAVPEKSADGEGGDTQDSEFDVKVAGCKH